MTFDEFLEKLNKKNPRYDHMASEFKRDIERGFCVLYQKGRDLPKVVAQLKQQGLFPVVDKKLRLVLGVVSHSVPRWRLFEYHYYAKNADLPYVGADEAADRYISEGHGWFISKMRPRIIVASVAYRPDQFDKDVFASYEIDHQDMTREEKLAIIRGERRFR